MASLKESRSHKGHQLHGLNIEKIVVNAKIEDSASSVSQNNVNKHPEIGSVSTEVKIETAVKNNDKDKKKQKQIEEKLKKEQDKKEKKEREENIKREKEQLKREKDEETRKAKKEQLIKEQKKKHQKEKDKHAKKHGKVVKEDKPKKKPEAKAKQDKAQAVASVTIDQKAVGSVQENITKPAPKVANPLAVPGNTYEPTEAFANWDMVAAHRQNIKRDIKPAIVPKSNTTELSSFAFVTNKKSPRQKNTIPETTFSDDEYNA